jgi:hypothetical protein
MLLPLSEKITKSFMLTVVIIVAQIDTGGTSEIGAGLE